MDLTFIQQILSSQNVHSIILSPPYHMIEEFDMRLRGSLYEDFDYQLLLDELLEVKAGNIVFYIDQFELHYGLIPIPNQDSYLCIGPYTFQLIDETKYKKLKQIFHFPDQKDNELKGYFTSVGQIISSSNFYALLIVLIKNIYGEEDFHISFSNFEFEKQQISDFQTDNIEPLLKIRVVEERYTNENELIDALQRGDINRALELNNIRQNAKIEARTNNPVRDTKNLLFVQNTLFRKAIEQNGIHPYYLDQISTKYAKMIERIQSKEEGNYVSVEMTLGYLDMVNRFSKQGYSPYISSILTYIDTNLMEPLSLGYLADLFHLSHSYLSTLFKNEVHMTITDYICKKRVDKACFYLDEGYYKISDIAGKVGYDDVNYFTKVFKKYKGMTPSQYRSKDKKN